uniref:BAG domain-containing protein n=1 Tax=Kalanchoe fedtschenkoi TaxID=63787 RepID=A0A7N0UN70_KALFE
MKKKSKSAFRKSQLQSSNFNSPFKTTTTRVIPIHDSQSQEVAAAVKIQSSYRAHLIRTLTDTIRAVNSEADRLQRTIQQQETVDAIRSSERERMRVSEALMRLLLKLDSVRGMDPAVRELRKSVSRKIVGLQEVVDALAAEEEAYGEFVRTWEEDLAAIEGEVCRERGGGEMERFCVEKLGFVCFQRFLRGGA